MFSSNRTNHFLCQTDRHTKLFRKLSDKMKWFILMLMMLRVGAEPNPDPTRMDTEKNEKTHIHTAGYFDWPEIELSETSKFTLIFIAVLCFYVIAFWIIHRGFNKWNDPKNSFLGSPHPPYLCGSSEQESPV